VEEYNKLISKLEDGGFGFCEYFVEVVEFYKDYFQSATELEKFLFNVYEYPNDPDSETITPRIMINSVQRLVTLADDMDKVRPQKPALKVFFLAVCIESLYVNAKFDKRFKKYEMIIDFFENYISQYDKDFIINRIRRSLADDKFVPGKTFDSKITMEIFSRIINEVRNTFVHQGDYWSFNLAQSNSDYALMQDIVIEEEKSKGKYERIYEIRLDYDNFKAICIRGFINFIINYIINYINTN
jgi:hypothetical protein